METPPEIQFQGMRGTPQIEEMGLDPQFRSSSALARQKRKCPLGSTITA